MPTNRFQFSDDFVLNNGNVGINSATPQEKLDVVGIVKGQDLKVVGVSSFTIYEGFLSNIQSVTESINLEAGNGISGSLSDETVVGTGLTLTGIGSAISGQGYIDSLKVYNTFTVPVGGTLDRPASVRKGMLFYNRDFATIEFWDGDRWRQVDNTTQRGRGVIGGGYAAPVSISTIEYVNISSTGNSQNFGALSVNRQQHQSCSSSIRGLFAGGYNPTFQNVIDYITIASEGNAIDFGDLVNGGRRRMTEGGLSSSTRGVFAGGYNPALSPSTTINSIEYVTISTIGNSLDFGDLIATSSYVASCASPTRGVYSNPLTPLSTTTIEAITIASTGNSIKFGDSTVYSYGRMGCSNLTRGIFGGGEPFKTIDYITIASFGNAINFGDLTRTSSYGSSTSNSIRGIFGGGYTSPTAVNTIDYINISSTGNATDFGDLSAAKFQISACSDSHGGLGGF